MHSNLTLIVVLLTVFHVGVLAVMLWIRIRPTEGDGRPVPADAVTPCAVCGDPADDWSYDGLDPHEQRDPRTGQAWSADTAHYRPVCQAHRAVSCPSAA